MSSSVATNKTVSLTGRPFQADGAVAVNGVHYDVGATVFRWDHAAGKDGYATNKAVVESEDRRTGEVEKRVIAGKRYSLRPKGIKSITQFLIHHTGGPRAEQCYETLHNERKLSVHFIISDQGIVFQTLDAVVQAWHAGKHNPFSVGVECALYPDAQSYPDYYNAKRREKYGLAVHKIITDEIQGMKRKVFAFTEVQVEALARVAAGVWTALHVDQESAWKISSMVKPLFPRTKSGDIPREAIANAKSHQGLLGHLHATRKKWDPAGFPWEDFEERVAELFLQFTKDGRSRW